MPKTDTGKPSASKPADSKPDGDKSVLALDFRESEQPAAVLVEFGSQLTPASPMAVPPEPDNIKKLEDLVGAAARPVFTAQPVTTGGPFAPASMMTARDPYLARFYEVPAATAADATKLSKEIRTKLSDSVSQATPVPHAVPAIAPARARTSAVDPATPDFRPLQSYLGAGPEGLNAYFAWQFPGGDGTGVTLIDVEGGWRLTHENLAGVRFNHWEGEINENPSWLEHGTAVVGMLAGPRDQVGVTGICPGARVGMVSAFETTNPAEQRVANQILKAIELLGPGDVMLIELQRPGPAVNFESNPDQRGYVPVSYWADVRTAIGRAVARGISVVEVGGNGGEDLDSQVYEGRFDQTREDSGSIMVGAGSPPGGTTSTPRRRLEFSNYGRRLDCQAWGDLVATSGYGDLWSGGVDSNRSYTGSFMGTSSAAPMVAGVVACLQGRAKMVYGAPIPPLTVRYALNTLGWQQDGTTGYSAPEHIGSQPDLGMLFQAFRLIG